MATSMADLGFNIDTRPLKRTTGELDRLGRESGRAEKAVTGFGGAANLARAAVAAFGAAVGGMTLGRIISETADFEQGMRNVAAVSGSTAAELDQLTESALLAAASTRFNPAQTTQALYALASSGQSASEQMASLNNVLNLAEAGQADLGSATELTTSTLNQFGLSASESGRVADVFVASIGASALNVNRLQVALRNAGPTAAALGQSLEGTTATLGMLTTAFGNGERAGTGFRAIMNELPDQAKALGIAVRDANGQFRPMVEILADLEAQGVTSSQVVSTFGAEAGPALAALLRNGSDALRNMEERLQSNGQAADTAAAQLDTLRGDMDAFASSVSVAMIGIGDSQAGMLRTTTQTVTNLIRLWSGYGDTLGDQREETQRLATALEAAAAAGAAMAGVAVAINAATVAQTAFNAAARANPYVLIATTIAGATAAVWAFANAQESALDVWERAQESEAAYQAAISNTGAANRIQEITQERLELQERLNDAQNRWIRNGREEAAIRGQLAELEREYHQITDARIEAEKARSDRQKEASDREMSALERQRQLQEEIAAAVGGGAGDSTEAAQKLIDSLDAELFKLQEGDRAWLARRLQMEGATEEQIKYALSVHDSIEATEAAKEREEERLENLREMSRITAEQDPMLQQVSAQGRGEDIIGDIRERAEAVRSALDEEFAAREAHKERVIALNDALRLGVIESAEERDRLEVESARRRNEQLHNIEMQKYEILGSGQEAFLSATENLFGNLASIAEKGGEDQFSTWKAMASAQAAVSTALAVANALTAAPPPLNFALAASVGALGAVQIAQIQSQEYQGSYLGGGYTGSGSRSGGVDGQGGFPAILHPDETVIDHRRGSSPSGEGGGDQNQTLVFQISGGDDGQKIQREIAKALPMIQQQSLNYFVSATQRGGSASRAVGRRP